MDVDLGALLCVNEEIAVAEDAGDASALDRLLAPTLAFRRANGTCASRDEFLGSVKPSGPRTTTVTSGCLLGRERAVVTCLVSMPVDGRQRSFGWANEPIPS